MKGLKPVFPWIYGFKEYRCRRAAMMTSLAVRYDVSDLDFWKGKGCRTFCALYRALLFFQIKSIFAGLLTTVSFPFRAIQHSFHFLPASLFWFFFFYLHHITAMFSCWVIAKISLLQDFREAGGGNSSATKWWILLRRRKWQITLNIAKCCLASDTYTTRRDTKRFLDVWNLLRSEKMLNQQV